jgi:hypothetical protein
MNKKNGSSLHFSFILPRIYGTFTYCTISTLKLPVSDESTVMYYSLALALALARIITGSRAKGNSAPLDLDQV